MLDFPDGFEFQLLARVATPPVSFAEGRACRFDIILHPIAVTWFGQITIQLLIYQSAAAKFAATCLSVGDIIYVLASEHKYGDGAPSNLIISAFEGQITKSMIKYMPLTVGAGRYSSAAK